MGGARQWPREWAGVEHLAPRRWRTCEAQACALARGWMVQLHASVHACIACGGAAAPRRAGSRVEGHEDALVEGHGAVAVRHADFRARGLPVENFGGRHRRRVERDVAVKVDTSADASDEGRCYQRARQALPRATPIAVAAGRWLRWRRRGRRPRRGWWVVVGARLPRVPAWHGAYAAPCRVLRVRGCPAPNRCASACRSLLAAPGSPPRRAGWAPIARALLRWGQKGRSGAQDRHGPQWSIWPTHRFFVVRVVTQASVVRVWRLAAAGLQQECEATKRQQTRRE